MPGGKPFLVLDLLCGSRRARTPVLERVKGRVHYIGVDKRVPSREKPGEPEPGENPHLTQEFHEVQLDFEDHGRLQEQLNSVLGERKADEIHFHLPPFEISNNNVMRVMADALKPGGRLYFIAAPLSLFEQVSLWETAKAEEPVEQRELNKQLIIQRVLPGSGLVLDNYVYRRPLRPDFYSSGHSKQTPGQRGRIASKFSELLEAYTQYPESASHLLVFRKPREPKTRE